MDIFKVITKLRVYSGGNVHMTYNSLIPIYRKLRDQVNNLKPFSDCRSDDIIFIGAEILDGNMPDAAEKMANLIDILEEKKS